MSKEEILEQLKILKSKYSQDGFNILALFGSYSTNSQNKNSDIDVLYDVDSSFLNKYKGFKSASKVIEIEKEISEIFHKKVELTSSSGLSENIKKEIISKALYV